MDRIRGVLERLRRTGRKALIPFLMGGDPTLAATRQMLLALAESGADLIEVGIPFSDPLADGPTIQQASQRALAHHTTPGSVLETVARTTPQMAVPIVLLSYWNPILRYGLTAFMRDAQRAGASGVIVPDLPVEEGREFRQAAGRVGIDSIFLAAPTSPPERLRQIARCSEGFIYYVSVTGTTGARQRLPAAWLHGVRQLKLVTTKPVCVGFGISTPSQAASVARVADGVIVGSALIRALEPALHTPRALPKIAAAFVRRLRRAV